MPLSKLQGAKFPAAADFHVHLRDGAMMELVTPTIRNGGVDTVFVMPNLVPPITTVEHCLKYQKQLQAIEPRVEFLMSLFLHESVTPSTIIEAKRAGISGVKSYPAGVTTNSSTGVTDYSSFYPVFAEMERQDLVLNLHGEVPSKGDITVLSAEERFLPILHELHEKFPNLRIVLGRSDRSISEHLTTAAAVEAVKKCGPTVSATITAHHLSIVVDSWAGDPFCFCRPVAKTPADRDALLRAVVSGNPKFFFGSDSAPHPVTAKRGGDKIAAGIFTQLYAAQYVIDALEQACESGVVKEDEVTVEKLEGFLSKFGRKFYGIEESSETFTLTKSDAKVMDVLQSNDLEVFPFRRGENIWILSWN